MRLSAPRVTRNPQAAAVRAAATYVRRNGSAYVAPALPEKPREAARAHCLCSAMPAARTQAAADVLIVDGTNLQIMSKTDIGWEVSHLQAFEAWLAALQSLTEPNQLYVVFDYKRGRSRGSGSAATPEVRKEYAPAYLQRRHEKQRGKQQQSPQHQQQQLQQQLRGAPGVRRQGAPGSVGVADGSPSGAGRVGTVGSSSSSSSSSSSNGGQHQGASSSRGRPADQRSPWDADADHPSEAPLHLKPFADVVRRYGGLCLYGRAGYEADDMIASLAAGLLDGHPQPLQQPVPSRATPATTSTSTSSTSSSASSRNPHDDPPHQPKAPAPHAATNPAVTHPATENDYSPTTNAHPTIVIASADRDMLQLLAHPSCAWLEVRQLSKAASAQQPPPLAVASQALPGVAPALMGLHRQAGAVPAQVGTVAQAPAVGPAVSAAAQGVPVPVAAAAPAGSPTPRGVEDGPAGGPTSCDTERGSAATGGGGVMQPPPQQQQQPEGVKSSSEGVLLHPGSYPHLLAFTGKPEAGVPGAPGVSARTARRLLASYGTVQGVVQAYVSGELDGALRPLQGRAAEQRRKELQEAGTAAAAGASTTAGKGGGVQMARAAVAGRKEGGGAHAGVPLPTGLEAALRNLGATQLYTDVGSVPWGVVREYQEGIRSRGDGEQRDGQGQGADGVVVGGVGGPGGAGAAERVRPPHLYRLCHPQDALHARSAAPYCAALAQALLPYGVPCRTSDLDEQGHLYDLVLGGSCGEGGGGWAGTTTGGLPVRGAGGGRDAVVQPFEHAGSVAEQLVRLLETAAAEAGGGDGGSVGANNSSTSSGGSSSRSGGGKPGAAGGTRVSGELGVLVLSPWDFDTDTLKQKLGGQGKQQGGKQHGKQQHGKQGQEEERQEQGKGQAQGQQQQQAPAPLAGGSPESRLLALARAVEDASGGAARRPTLLHTPPSLLSLLRPSSAWRLKALQRRGGRRLAVVGFHQLLLPPSGPQAQQQQQQ